jgi:signal peptidase I
MTSNGEIKIKRIIGLPGETIEIADGKVMIDKIEIEERYLEEHVHTCLP